MGPRIASWNARDRDHQENEDEESVAQCITTNGLSGKYQSSGSYNINYRSKRMGFPRGCKVLHVSTQSLEINIVTFPGTAIHHELTNGTDGTYHRE